MKDKLLQIVRHYGIYKQLKYIHSEYYELDESILDYEHDETGYVDTKHIAEEISDVMVMLKQFQYYYGIEDEQIKNIMDYKIQRQLERIEKEKQDV